MGLLCWGPSPLTASSPLLQLFYTAEAGESHDRGGDGGADGPGGGGDESR